MSVRQSFAAKVAAATVVVLVLVVGSSSALAGAASPRGGDLVVAKECSGFNPTNNPPYCQITASSLEQIEVGSKIFYLNPAGLRTPAGGAVVLDPPKPGNNKAFGTCFLGDPNAMHCEFSGGTGEFTWFQRRGYGRLQWVVALGWDVRLQPSLTELDHRPRLSSLA